MNITRRDCEILIQKIDDLEVEINTRFSFYEKNFYIPEVRFNLEAFKRKLTYELSLIEKDLLHTFIGGA